MHPFNLESSDPRERKLRLRAAAREGCNPATYDYGLTCDDPCQSEHWLAMAAREGNSCALFLLGQNLTASTCEQAGGVA